MSFSKPRYTRSGTLILNTPDYIGSRKPTFKRQQTSRVTTAYIAKPRSGLSLFQSKKNAEEWKNVDVTGADVALPQTQTWSAPVLLNLATAGTGPQNRIGRRILMRSVNYRFHLGEADGASATGGIGATNIRVLVVYDKQTNGGNPAITDVLTADSFQSPNNLANTDRFLIVSDQIFQTGDTTQATIGKHGRKLSLDTMFNNGGAGTVADVNSGGLFVFFSTANMAAGPPVINYYFRVRYTDA